MIDWSSYENTVARSGEPTPDPAAVCRPEQQSPHTESTCEVDENCDGWIWGYVFRFERSDTRADRLIDRLYARFQALADHPRSH